SAESLEATISQMRKLLDDGQVSIEAAALRFPSGQRLLDWLTGHERDEWFDFDDDGKPKLKKEKRSFRDEVQMLVFSRMTYDEKLEYCDRPENIGGPSEDTWKDINAYFGTNAQNLSELVRELGVRQFGHTVRVGDAFCGGGSIPFEAA